MIIALSLTIVAGLVAAGGWRRWRAHRAEVACPFCYGTGRVREIDE